MIIFDKFHNKWLYNIWSQDVPFGNDYSSIKKQPEYEGQSFKDQDEFFNWVGKDTEIINLLLKEYKEAKEKKANCFEHIWE